MAKVRGRVAALGVVVKVARRWKPMDDKAPSAPPAGDDFAAFDTATPVQAPPLCPSDGVDWQLFAAREFADRSRQRPGHLGVSLSLFGRLSLHLDQIMTVAVGDRRRYREQKLGRRLTISEREEIRLEAARHFNRVSLRIKLLTAESAAAPFRSKPLSRHRHAQVLHLAAGLLTLWAGRPKTVRARLVYEDFQEARARLRPLARELRMARTPVTVWKRLEAQEPEFTQTLGERGLKKKWFTPRERPTLDQMAAEWISAAHPDVTINTLIRYGRRKPLN